jgi:hypothetical protein
MHGSSTFGGGLGGRWRESPQAGQYGELEEPEHSWCKESPGIHAAGCIAPHSQIDPRSPPLQHDEESARELFTLSTCAGCAICAGQTRPAPCPHPRQHRCQENPPAKRRSECEIVRCNQTIRSAVHRARTVWTSAFRLKSIPSSGPPSSGPPLSLRPQLFRPFPSLPQGHCLRLACIKRPHLGRIHHHEPSDPRAEAQVGPVSDRSLY